MAPDNNTDTDNIGGSKGAAASNAVTTSTGDAAVSTGDAAVSTGDAAVTTAAADSSATATTSTVVAPDATGGSGSAAPTTETAAAVTDSGVDEKQQQCSTTAADASPPAAARVESSNNPNTDSAAAAGDASPTTAEQDGTAQNAMSKDAPDTPPSQSNLDKNRNRSELMSELRKLRSQIADVRSRALATQSSLIATRTFVESCTDKLSTEQKEEWSEIEKSIIVNLKSNEEAALRGDEAIANSKAQNENAKRARQPRGTRRNVTKQKNPKMIPEGNGGQNMVAALARGIQQQAAMEQHAAVNAMQQQYRQVQYPGSAYGNIVGGGMPRIVAPVQQQQKKGKRRRQPSHTDVGPKHADDIAKAESIRTELRAAGTAEELTSAMSKARKAEMSHELQIAQKKMVLFKNASQSSTEASAASSRVPTANSNSADTAVPTTTAPTATTTAVTSAA